MNSLPASPSRLAPPPPAFWGRAAGFGLLLFLGACATSGALPPAPHLVQGYPAPGPDSDPWGPYIAEASARFDVSPDLIRTVIWKESRGEVHAVSREGARGLMQLMPRTYEAMRAKYGLGADPFAPRDNILAGTAYLHDLAAEVGPGNVLAAYNAGPEAWLAHARRGKALPAETIAYVRSLPPRPAETSVPSSHHGTARHAAGTKRKASKTSKAKKRSAPPAPLAVAEH